MSEELLARAARALRDETDGEEPRALATRARVLARIEEARARRRRRLAVLLPLAATFVAGTVFGASGGRGEALVQSLSRALGLAPAEEAAPAASRPEVRHGRPASPEVDLPAAAPATTAPAAETAAPTAPPLVARTQPPRATRAPTTTAPVPAPGVSAAPSPDDALYREAHHVHFVERDPTRALAAWDRYLATAPTGRFALEARYNRAICLVRLGRTAEARAALEPFASGALGAYRRGEAAELLEALPP